jgi:hypothetical protein
MHHFKLVAATHSPSVGQLPILIPHALLSDSRLSVGLLAQAVATSGAVSSGVIFGLWLVYIFHSHWSSRLLHPYDPSSAVSTMPPTTTAYISFYTAGYYCSNLPSLKDACTVRLSPLTYSLEARRLRVVALARI